MEKAAREAKQHTTWNEPVAPYEEALKNFVTSVMSDTAFKQDAEQFVRLLVRPGYINSLSQTLIKLTAPGVPDIYQGCEIGSFTLVDPDNRQAVDFELRRHLLEQARGMSAEEAWIHRDKGLAKQWLIWKTLTVRAERPEHFAKSQEYQPLFADGAKRAHVVAYQRGSDAITVVQRLPLTLGGEWEDTTLPLPSGRWRNLMGGDLLKGGGVDLKQLLKSFPVALLIREQEAI
jgi:(1->4)-alpha-D-glucan 1-alpha-D-glucosylmutase